jgi:pyruvoyl-dependent arginine decarboxylase-like protein
MARPELSDLRAVDAHPNSPFQIGGLYTRRAPYPSFQILSHKLLTSSSTSLLGSAYYDRFTAGDAEQGRHATREFRGSEGALMAQKPITMIAGAFGHAEGKTPLNAFDNALLAAGIGNVNLRSGRRRRHAVGPGPARPAGSPTTTPRRAPGSSRAVRLGGQPPDGRRLVVS